MYNRKYKLNKKISGGNVVKYYCEKCFNIFNRRQKCCKKNPKKIVKAILDTEEKQKAFFYFIQISKGLKDINKIEDCWIQDSTIKDAEKRLAKYKKIFMS